MKQLKDLEQKLKNVRLQAGLDSGSYTSEGMLLLACEPACLVVAMLPPPTPSIIDICSVYIREWLSAYISLAFIDELQLAACLFLHDSPPKICQILNYLSWFHILFVKNDNCFW